MPRLSELIRKSCTSAVLSPSFIELEYSPGPKTKVALPSLENPDHLVVPQDGHAVDESMLVQMVEKEFASLAAWILQDTPISLDGMREIALRIVQDLHDSEQLVAHVFSSNSFFPRIVSNSFNVAVLSTKIGMGLSYPSKELIDLALVALLHDIGKFHLPEASADKTVEHGSGNEKHLREHPEIGYKILKKVNNEPWLAEVVRQEHERWGGQGYPKGLKGEEIHKFAQIIGLADRFETMIHRDGLPSHEAIRILLTHEKAVFRGQLLKALVHQISLFPIGTVVRLNTGEVGTVEKTNTQHPLRPILRMKPLSNERSGNGSTLRDLSQDTLVHIEEVIRDHQGK